MKRFRRAAGAGLLLLALAAGGSWAAQSAGPQTHVVLIENMKFSPATLTVQPGDTVEFKNADLVPHTATERSGQGFDSKLINRNETWKLVAGHEGTLLYRCSFHPDMLGTIIVGAPSKPAAAATPAVRASAGAAPVVELCGNP